MTDANNRGRRRSGPTESSRARRSGRVPTAGAKPASSTPVAAGIWVLVDGWVRDARVRRDVLIGLGMVLAAVVCTAAALAGWAEPLLRQVLTNTTAQIAAGAAAVGGLGYGGLRRMRRRRTARSR